MINKEQVAAYMALQARIQALQAEVDEMKASFKAELEELDIDTMKVDDYTLTLKQYTRGQFDSKRFAEEHPRLATKYRKEIACESFKITRG